MKMEI